jgi:hypothetical protein
MLIDRFGLPSFLGNNIPMDSHDAAGPNHRPIGNLRVARSTYTPLLTPIRIACVMGAFVLLSRLRQSFV